jgi:hypothetical protein
VQRLQRLKTRWAYIVCPTTFISGSSVYVHGVYGGDFGIDVEPLVEVYKWTVLSIFISSDFWLCWLVHEA